MQEEEECDEDNGCARVQISERRGADASVYADVLPNERLLRLLKEVSTLSAAVRKRRGIMEREEYVLIMRSTNPEQYELLREILHRQTTQGQPPLRVFFTGPTGCGKTFVLKLAMDVYNRCADCCGAVGWEEGCSSSVPSVYNAYVVCASTGKAAVAVVGTTVHSAFKLVRAARGNRQDVRLGVWGDGGLRPSDLNTFRCAFRRVKCVIIDEVSMMSADQLKLVDCRVRQIKQRLTEPFGGLEIILCGNPRQLPPVCASEIFKRPRSADGLLGFSTVTWHHLEYFPLVRVVRQLDVTFSLVLTKIGDGRALEPEEVKLLETRFVTVEEAAERAPSAVRIFYSNADVTRFNETVARSQDDFVVLRARDRYLGCKTPHLLENAKRRVARKVPSEFANLPVEVMAVVGKPYLMTHNIDLVDGLVNGAVGVLHLCEPTGPLPDDGDGVDEEGEGDGNEETRLRRLFLEFDVPGTRKLTRARAAQAVHEARSNGYDGNHSLPRP
nr:ATP-dependent DNA helicase PIF1-like [Rhipicephalus microplus]